jgi:hypothetical protein
MIRPISNVRRHARTLMAIVLLAGWPAVAGAEAIGDTALVLHPDAYWYNNENHTPSAIQAPTPSVVETTPETWGTARVLHPDAYWYNNENHALSAPEASTPSVHLASPAR